jgi:hypothetical protein
MVVIECPNSRKRRRTIEPMGKLQLPAAKKSRSSRSNYIKPNQPDRTSIYSSSQHGDRSHYVGKRGRATEDEEPTKHTHKSPRLQENRQYFYILALVLSVHCQCHLPSAVNKAENRVQSQHQPRRKSPRLPKIRQLNQQKLEKPTRSSLRPIKTHHGVGEEEAQASCRIPRAPRNCQLTHAVVIIHVTD